MNYSKVPFFYILLLVTKFKKYRLIIPFLHLTTGYPVKSTHEACELEVLICHMDERGLAGHRPGIGTHKVKCNDVLGTI